MYSGTQCVGIKTKSTLTGPFIVRIRNIQKKSGGRPQWSGWNIAQNKIFDVERNKVTLKLYKHIK